MFKLSVFTDEISQDFAHAVDVAVEYGCKGVEVRSVWDHPPQEIPKADIARMKSILADKGLAVSCVASPFYKCELDSKQEIATHHDILKRCIDLATALDCRIVRTFSFWRRHELDDATWRRILDEFQKPVEIACDAKVILALENESSTYIGTGACTARLLKALAAPELKVIWDPQNAVVDPDEKEEPFPDGYDAVKANIVHVHVKDCTIDRATGKFACCQVGSGVIDWPGQFRALLKDGYSAYCSLETHWRPNTLTEEEMNKPGGATFSKDGEFASRQCLGSINAMLEKIA